MSTEYSQLNTNAKRVITHTIALKRAMETAQANYKRMAKKAFPIVKECNGVISKNGDILEYIAQGNDTPILDTESLARDYPEIYAKYLTKSRKGAKEHISVVLA